jgi:hypothetical protein
LPPSLELLNSNAWRRRLLRHLLFWLIYLAGYSLVDLDMEPNPDAGLALAIRWMPYTMLNTYVILYWIVERFLLRSRYRAFFIALASWTILTIPLAFLSHIYMAYPYCWPPGPRPTIRQALPAFFDIYPMIVCEVIAGFAVFLRMHKFWRVEMLEKMQLKQQTTEAELKLLKAQLNPHFLFNTLNNLYTLILKKSERAPAMLLQLTAILDHVTRQGHSAEVPLRQEIDFCRDYIELEKERYGNRLHMTMDISGDLDHQTVVPMLFQPLIENAFKHGASEQLGKVWIDIRLTVDERQLFFRVVNSAVCPAKAGTPDGIGIANIRRRLQLLYPGRHHFSREQSDTQHSVWLTIDLPANDELLRLVPLGDKAFALRQVF